MAPARPLVLLAMLAAGLSACGDDDENDNNPPPGSGVVNGTILAFDGTPMAGVIVNIMLARDLDIGDVYGIREVTTRQLGEILGHVQCRHLGYTKPGFVFRAALIWVGYCNLGISLG